jgi:hypothetical protein
VASSSSSFFATCVATFVTTFIAAFTCVGAGVTVAHVAIGAWVGTWITFGAWVFHAIAHVLVLSVGHAESGKRDQREGEAKLIESIEHKVIS